MFQPLRVLVVDDAFQVQRAGDEHDAEHRHAQRDFVADELALERRAPRKLYLLFDDQPPSTMP